jgi:hypothetical protein
MPLLKKATALDYVLQHFTNGSERDFECVSNVAQGIKEVSISTLKSVLPRINRALKSGLLLITSIVPQTTVELVQDHASPLLNRHSAGFTRFLTY